MNQKELEKIFKFLGRQWQIFAPQLEGDNLAISAVENFAEIDWSGEIPLETWKKFLIPSEERLFVFDSQKSIETLPEIQKNALWGVNVLDLKAITLIDQVFGKDPYYQKRRSNSLLIGYSGGLESDYKKYKVLSHNLEENVLEHLAFDIFIVKLKNGQVKLYSGSRRGQETLDKSGAKDYENIEFAGPVPEKGTDKRMLSLMDKMEKSYGTKIWKDLDKICIACGKCAINCPTCFCFDVVDKSDPKDCSRCRNATTCFYNDFSLVAGGHKELDKVKQKIYFWYAHKFIRIPFEYNLPGCVGCGRCTRVCPVGIKLNDVLAEVGKTKEKKVIVKPIKLKT